MAWATRVAKNSGGSKNPPSLKLRRAKGGEKMNLKSVLTPKGFLTVGGVILVLIGVLGYINVIGPTPQQSIFGDFWWFDNAENVAHLVLGIVALAAAYLLKDAGLQRMLVWLVAVIALLVAAYNLMGSVNLLGANLESPADLVLHLVVGVWAVLAAMSKPSAARA